MDGRYFIIGLAVPLLIWAGREICECNTFGVNPEKDKPDSEPPTPSQSVGKTKKRKNGWCDYLQKPKNIIALLTLIFVGTYTIITYLEWQGSLDSDRPWVGLFALTYPDPVAGQPFPVSVVFENGGKSIAVNVRAHFSVYLVYGESEPIISDVPCSDCTGEVMLPNVPIGRRPEIAGTYIDSTSIGDVTFRQNQKDQPAWIVVVGRIDYDSTAGKHYATGICYRLTWLPTQFAACPDAWKANYAK